MKETLKVLNRMVKDGVIREYADMDGRSLARAVDLAVERRAEGGQTSNVWKRRNNPTAR